MTKYFSTETLSDVSAEDVSEYPLPFDTDMLVRVKSVPMARMKQYQELAAKGGSVAAAAEKSLIRDSIINPDGSPVYSSEAVAEQMLKGRTRLVAALIKMISLHNGGEDKIVEDAAKKSETTA